MNEVINLLKKLITIKSYSGKEGLMANFIFSWFSQQKVQVRKQSGNIIAFIKGENSRMALIFNGHMDTVSANNKFWSFDPLTPTIIGNKLYGLGSSDMKIALAAMMMCAKKMKLKELKCDLWFVFVTREETDGVGTKNFLGWFKKTGYLSKYAKLATIIGEPTGLEAVDIGHRGNIFVKLTTKGDGGHASEPNKIKTKAIFSMYEVLKNLKRLNNDWQKKYSHQILGQPSIGIGTAIKAGDLTVPNKFAESCQATLDIRTTPRLHNEAFPLLKKFLGNKIDCQYLYPPVSYGLTDSDDPLVKTIKKIRPGIKLVIAKGSSDQCLFNKEGIPAVSLGPGEKSCLHIADEYCKISKVAQAIDLYRKIIKTWPLLN